MEENDFEKFIQEYDTNKDGVFLNILKAEEFTEHIVEFNKKEDGLKYYFTACYGNVIPNPEGSETLGRKEYWYPGESSSVSYCEPLTVEELEKMEAQKKIHDQVKQDRINRWNMMMFYEMINSAYNDSHDTNYGVGYNYLHEIMNPKYINIRTLN